MAPPPPPLLDDALRSALRASAPNKRPSRLIISLPADGEGLAALRLLELAVVSIVSGVVVVVVVVLLDGEGDNPVRLRLLHNERPDCGDALIDEGIVVPNLRRTNGEVTANHQIIGH